MKNISQTINANNAFNTMEEALALTIKNQHCIGSSVGYYVRYKSWTHIIVIDNGDGLVHINTPTGGRYRVSIRNVELMKCDPAHVIAYRGDDYIVTKYGHIFSCTTGKLMKWCAYHTERKDLLALGGAS